RPVPPGRHRGHVARLHAVRGRRAARRPRRPRSSPPLPRAQAGREGAFRTMTAPHLSPETAVAHAYGLTRDSAAAADIERHVGTCADCSRRLKELRQDRDGLGEALRTETLPAAEAPPTPSIRRRRPWIESLAAALCLAAVGFALFGSWRDRQPAGQS